MAQVKIVTDSTARLSDEEIAKYDIKVIPLTVMIDGTVYTDGETLSAIDFMDRMAEAENLPTTSQPALGAFTQVYESFAPDDEIISLHLTRNLSGTVTAAEQAARLVDRDITVIDTAFIDRASAFQVIEAAKLAQAGAAKVDILAKIAETQANTKLFVTIAELKNLVAGGRLSKTAGFISSVLNVKLGARVVEGNINVEAKGRGQKAITKYIDGIIEEVQADAKQVIGIGLSHAGIPEEAAALGKKLQAVFADAKIDIQQTTPVVATHTGVGAFGISILEG
ncbi:DegV family protein [Weissella oryzae SG25]|uniref:DegV family protein n=1 Tax=Weissella oryzae (strain DSM 25784 / JCM 18191 / LMG 30913 / SG25) TaxID=1329250 RepID=A0A069CSA2_WEIOS|nr:DegV family protein [Weissella oryzae]GAK30324.1 DegV family protein [Weissella oryzae SG25]